MLGNCNWPNLIRLSLTSINIDVPSFKRFLVLHKESLRELNLEDAKLNSASNEAHTWVYFLKFMKLELRLSELGLGGDLQEVHLDTITLDLFAPFKFRSGWVADWAALAG